MTGLSRVSRRRALKLAATAALPLVHIRTAGAAGTLKVSFYDHFIKGANDEMRRLVDQWAGQTKTEVQLDFLSDATFLAVPGAESLAAAGHDVQTFVRWGPYTYADRLEPMDDVIGHLVSKYGSLSPMVEYLGKVDGAFRAMPTSFSSLNFPSCTRIDLFKQYVGMNVQEVFPAATATGPGYEQWTWDAFLVAAEKCAKVSYPFGLPMGKTADSKCWVDALCRGFGALLVDAEGNITANSDAVRAMLDYAQRLMPFLPQDVYGWDNASNNRALISGKSALIFNAPSAWAVALRDNPPVGTQIWHHPLPTGEHGRFTPFTPFFWGIWSFSRNKAAAKELVAWLSEREQVERLCNASRGYDIPPFVSMNDFAVWAEEGPPNGTLFNYPVKPQHHAEPAVVGWPAPPAIAMQIDSQATVPKMIARVTQSGMSIEQSIALVERELEGFTR